MLPRCRNQCCILAAAFSLTATMRANAELAASSPFLPPQGQMTAAPAAQTPLEFRGVTADGGNTKFSIFDPTKKSGTWVGLNESGPDFMVKKYDPDSETVTVDFQGRSMSLVMRTPKVASSGNAIAPLPAPMPMPIPGPTPGVPMNPVNRNVVANPTPASEAARLADWQAEIQRRRDMRAAQTTQPAPAVQPTPPAAQPQGQRVAPARARNGQ